MKKSVGILIILLLAACAPSKTGMVTSIAQTQDLAPTFASIPLTVTAIPRNSPVSSATQTTASPTETFAPTETPTGYLPPELQAAYDTFEERYAQVFVKENPFWPREQHIDGLVRLNADASGNWNNPEAVKMLNEFFVFVSLGRIPKVPYSIYVTGLGNDHQPVPIESTRMSIEALKALEDSDVKIVYSFPYGKNFELEEALPGAWVKDKHFTEHGTPKVIQFLGITCVILGQNQAEQESLNQYILANPKGFYQEFRNHNRYILDIHFPPKTEYVNLHAEPDNIWIVTGEPIEKFFARIMYLSSNYEGQFDQVLFHPVQISTFNLEN